MKQRIFSCFIGLLHYALKRLGQDTRRAFGHAFSAVADEPFAVQTRFGPILLHCPNELTQWRATTFFTKEPETLEWIDGFAEGDTLWDIGANIGCYTLYAARQGRKVLAFEPAFTNYALLNRNIATNGLDGLVRAYCLALAERPQADALCLADLSLGAANCQFGAPRQRTHVPGNRAVAFRQGMFGLAGDALVHDYGLDAPTHIKIDVDGIEELILLGARQTLRDPRLKSVLVEIDSADAAETEGITRLMSEAGLTLARRAHSAMIEQGPYSTTYNYIFVRGGDAGSRR